MILVKLFNLIFLTLFIIFLLLFLIYCYKYCSFLPLTITFLFSIIFKSKKECKLYSNTVKQLRINVKNPHLGQKQMLLCTLHNLYNGYYNFKLTLGCIGGLPFSSVHTRSIKLSVVLRVTSETFCNTIEQSKGEHKGGGLTPLRDIMGRGLQLPNLAKPFPTPSCH